ncbi:thioesterase II family protein [Amycolatopsis sacchari]|uniref:thioesterase II family protein n=1 Tax=Amycolatopsis sacchari TaxID=115433 RepID=UPI003D7610A6
MTVQPGLDRGVAAVAATPGGWFVRLERRERARARLYVFPHAGGGPGAVTALAAALPETVEPWALNLPGRQARLDEPPRTDLGPLVTDLARDLATQDAPGTYFGYCGGALLAYLVARQCPPARLFVGSFAAPDVALVPRRLHLLPGARFWDVVLDQGGVPPELAVPELRPVFEDALRADFALYAGYHHRPAAPLDVPITVLHGRRDTGLSRGGLLGWRRHTTSVPEWCALDTGHWLVDEAPHEVAAHLEAGVRR